MLSQKDKDKKLLELIKKHPNRGMKLLMNEYGGLVFYVVQKRLQNNMNDIEECVSDVFIDFYSNINSVDLNKGSIKAFLVTIATRKYDRILRFWPVAIINGKEYPGYVGESFRDENELCTDYEFNIPVEEDFGEFEIKITDCMVITKTEGITVGLPKKEYGSQIGTCDGVIDGFEVTLQEAKYLSKDEADSEWGDYAADIFSDEPGDRIEIKLQAQEDTTSIDDNLKFYGFQKILVNGDSSKTCKSLICGEDRSEYCICPRATKDEIDSLLFTEPIYIIKDCGSMVVNLYR